MSRLQETDSRGLWGDIRRIVTHGLSFYRGLVLAVACVHWQLTFGTVARAAEVDFAGSIWPILKSRCIACHGPDKQKSSLRVDSRKGLVTGGDSGAAIVPGNPDDSYLLELVSATDDGMRMPPAGDPLTVTQISQLRQWILEGAKWPGAEEQADPRLMHWAFQPVTRPVVPRILDRDRISPIDAFLLAQLEQRGLRLSSAADAQTFIRRVTLDLTGLPPTPEEVAAFVEECARKSAESTTSLPDDVVERLIDRLLASPHYGERWAQHWLDVIRYADTTGYEKNRVRANAWPYRDYVIAALNADIRYPRFILEQLAGDTLGVDPATGFLVTPPFPEPIEVGQEPALIAQVRFNGLDEVVQNVASSMLGMTIGCARCHDHKFDPVSVRDYYRLAATFGGLEFDERRWERGAVPVERKRGLEHRMEQVRRELQGFRVWRETEPRRVSDVFEPVRARWIRLTVTSVSESENKRYAPAFDEIQVWSSGRAEEPAQNVGSAACGAVACSSGTDDKLGARDEFLNDGVHGAVSLWVASTRPEVASTWVEIELREPRLIDRVAWCADPAELDKTFVRLMHRSPQGYRVEVAERPGEWHTIVSVSRDDGLTPAQARDRRKLEKEFEVLADGLRELTYVFAGNFHAPAPMHVLRRGDPQQPREPIGAGGVDILGGYELPQQAPDFERRLALARWLGSESHPLTARVLVNRVWHHHFGTGIVDTPSDFGTQGARPTHPELLDWLAAEFMGTPDGNAAIASLAGTAAVADGTSSAGAPTKESSAQAAWSLKRLHKLICLSAVYRQSSRPDAAAIKIDADSRLLWRFPPRRLEAEAIRDSMLAVSGSLDLTAGGPGVNIFESQRFGAEWQPRDSPGPETWRRAIYLLRVRGADDGLFKPFDVPDCGQVRAKRSESSTPLQALNLFNSPFIVEQAQRLAERAASDAGGNTAARIDRVFALTLGRAPSAGERSACVQTAERHGLETVCRAMLNSNEFLFLE